MSYTSKLFYIHTYDCKIPEAKEGQAHTTQTISAPFSEGSADGFWKPVGIFAGSDITLWQVPVNWNFSLDKWHSSSCSEKRKGKEVKFGDARPCFARVG